MSDDRIPRTVNHWWWRPGWGPGTRFYTWHVTFQEKSNIHQLADVYRNVLGSYPSLDLVPDEWLHMTVQGLGFVEEVSEEDVTAIVAEVQARLGKIPAFTIEMDRPSFTPEAVRWDPQGPVWRVRQAIRDAIATVWPTVPEPEEGFTPHVTIAYANQDRPAGEILQAMGSVAGHPTSVTISSVDLIILNRDQKMYQWTTCSTARLTGSH